MTPFNHPTRELSNRILSAAPKGEYERLLPHLEYVELRLGETVQEPGEPITHAYFPYSGVVSLVALSPDGKEVEVGMVGREGMVGLPLALGTDSLPFRAYAQVSGGGVRVKAGVFKQEMGRCGGLFWLLLRYSQALFVETAQTAACNRLHGLDARLCRWLLMTRDRARSDSLDLTHEFMAVMLGVRRAGVTEAAGKLKAEGLIDYERGVVRVLDAEGLERAACECYGVTREEFRRLAA